MQMQTLLLFEILAMLQPMVVWAGGWQQYTVFILRVLLDEKVAKNLNFQLEIKHKGCWREVKLQGIDHVMLYYSRIHVIPAIVITWVSLLLSIFTSSISHKATFTMPMVTDLQDCKLNTKDTLSK